jgi:hypothetical protein
MKIKTAMGALSVFGLAALSLVSNAPSAFAFGGCGPNGHRNYWGRCVCGGQNQNWCGRTGGYVVRNWNGNYLCLH